MAGDSFGAIGTLEVGGRTYGIAHLAALERAGVAEVSRLPCSIRILLEALLRREDGRAVTREDVLALARWAPGPLPEREIPFFPARVILQDFTGVPLLVDLAAMRDAAAALGADPGRVNPILPVDLVIDHSVQVDAWGSPDAERRNADLEHARNRERYAFLRWGQKAFRGLRVVPPATGIVHQVNLEHLASVVIARGEGKLPWAFPDTLVGTDSHTTMVNGLGVLGWGVGGIEAEAAMLGQPQGLKIPEIVGVRLSGGLPEGTTATDAVLTVTERLRKTGVVEKFVEFFGPGLDALSLADRATIANMCPEYGATVAYFPVDDETLGYLRLTGRDPALVALVEAYTREQGLFRSPGSPEPRYSAVVEIDLAAIERSLAGPKRPQDRVPLSRAAAAFCASLAAPVEKGGFGLAAEALPRTAPVPANGGTAALGHGAVVIAAITSCTNTSNPSVMLGAGILARKAAERGLKPPPHVKTSLAPGSRVVADYLERAGVLRPLEALGFHLVGFGCTTCIGNSGPLPEPVAKAVKEGDLVAVSVLSGNRNFEGRIHPQVRANYLASPPLVVAYALAGRMDVDLEREPIGTGRDGRPVYLKDLWPSGAEVREAITRSVRPEMFRDRYERAFDGDERWRALPVPEGLRAPWDAASTYVRRPPYFDGVGLAAVATAGIRGARVLALLGDSVTTDHISPAGSIAADSPAGLYLLAHGVAKPDFNSYGARRGNHEVMVRGTFANVRLKNLLLPGTEGGITVHVPSGRTLAIFDAAEEYRREGTALIVLAGKEYGSGSSRDWAAKGPALLGVRAVIAESFERIHRSNLVGMGILPLQFAPGQGPASLGLAGREAYDVEGIAGGIAPRATLRVSARRPDGRTVEFDARARIDTPLEAETFRHGGILPLVLRQIGSAARRSPPRRTRTPSRHV